MPYFLVHTTVALPVDEDPEIDWRRVAEVERARELQNDGTLVGLWRETGKLASFGIWRASDETAVRALAATLPMWRYMTVEITQVQAHPNAIAPYLLEAEYPG